MSKPLTYKQLYEALKPFALDSKYANDVVDLIPESVMGNPTHRVVAIDEDGYLQLVSVA